MANSFKAQIVELFEQQKYGKVTDIISTQLNEVEDIIEKKDLLFLSSQANYYLSNNKRALEDIIECKKLMTEISVSVEERIDVDIQKAKIFRRLGEKEKSLDIYDKILKNYQEAIKEGTKAKIYHNLANLHLERGNFEQSKSLFEQAIEIDRKTDNEIGLAQSFSGLGGLYFYLGEFDQAIDYYQRSLKIRSKSKDHLGEATLLFNLGSTFANMLNEKNALSYLTKSENIFKKLNHIKGVQTVLDTKARMFYNLKKYDSVIKNLEYLQEVSIKEIKNNNLTMYLILAESLLKNNQINEAEKLINKVLEAADIFNEEQKKLHISEISNLMHLKSQMYFKNKEYHLALNILEELQNLATVFSDEESLVALYFSKAEIYFVTDKDEKAKECAQSGLKLASKLKNPTLITFLDLLFGIHWKQADFEECIHYTKELTHYVQIDRRPVLEIIIRTLQLAEDDKIIKLGSKDYNSLLEETQILAFYQDLISIIISGKITLNKLEKIMNNFKYESNLQEDLLSSYILLSLNLVKLKQEEMINFLPALQNGNKRHSLFSRISIKQVLTEDIIENIEDALNQNTIEFYTLLQILDIIYYSIVFGFISKKFLLELNWSKKIKGEKRILVKLKQKLMVNSLKQEQISLVSAKDDITTTNAFILYEKIIKNILDKIEIKEVETKSLLYGIIADLVIRTIVLINSGELNGPKTKETN